MQAPDSLAGQDDKCPSCGALCRIPSALAILSPSAERAPTPPAPPVLSRQPLTVRPPARVPRFWGLLVVGVLAILVGGIDLAAAAGMSPDNVLQQNVQALAEIRGVIVIATGLLLLAIGEAAGRLCRFAAQNMCG